MVQFLFNKQDFQIKWQINNNLLNGYTVYTVCLLKMLANAIFSTMIDLIFYLYKAVSVCSAKYFISKP